jgi:hypothetical protein
MAIFCLFWAIGASRSMAAAHAALGGGLRELASSYENHSPVLATQLKLHLTDKANNPLVRIHLAPGRTAQEVIRPLEALGFRLQTISSINVSLLDGYLPLSAIKAASAIPGILSLLATQHPVHMAGTPAAHVAGGPAPQMAGSLAASFGTVPHQAAVLEKANLVQAAGINGAGISVGVLSDSYDTCNGCSTTAAKDIAAGNLPAAGVAVIAEGPLGDTDEGRAMLQLVYDIAPGAALGFATADNGQLSFAENILALRTVFGADIIVDDTFYFAEPFYSDGIVAQAVDLVAESGAGYFSCAGNNGLEAYEATYAAVPFAAAQGLGAKGRSNLKLDQIPSALRPISLHDFKNPDGTISVTQRITSATLNGNHIEFQWDEPFDLGLVKTDYNIYVFDSDGNWINPETSFYVTYTTDNNVQTDQPNEYLFLSPSPNQIVGDAYQTDYQIVIGKMNEGPAQRIKYIVINSLAPSERQNAPSIYGHAAASGAQAVGAAYYAIPGVPEDFSSDGPVTILFDTLGNRLATPDVRTVPQLVAADGVDTSFFGGSDTDGDGFPNFFGTSAAAPDAAAVGALLLQQAGGSGSLRPQALYKTLQRSASPMLTAARPWDASAQAGPVHLNLNGDWVRWDRDFTLSLAKDSLNSVFSVSFDTTLPGLVWNPDPNRFSIGSSTDLTYEDIYIFTGTIGGAPSPQLTMFFSPGTFTAGGFLTYGLSVYNPLQGSAREDGYRLDGTNLTVTLDNGDTYSATIKRGPTEVHGPFTGFGLVDAEKAVFP